MGVETSPRRLIVVGVVAVTRAIQVAAANTLTVAPLPIAPRADVKTCDDGHGAFTCTSGDCFFGSRGAFACCENPSDCYPITSCIDGFKYKAYSEPKSCKADDKACTSCGADDDLCYTVINPVVRQTWIRCNAVGGWYPTYFSYNRWTTRPFTTDVRPSVTATLTVTVDNPLSSTSINSNPTTTDGSAGPGPTVQESTSDFVSITSITSSQDPVAAAPTPTCGDFDPYCTRPPAEPAKLTSKGLAGAILGAVAGVAALALAFYLLFKLYRKRRQWQSRANEGTLPGPRNPSNENKRPGKVDTSNQLSSDPEDSSPSSYKRFLIAANHPSKATELSDLPSSKRQSVATVSTRTNEDLDTLSSTDTPLLPELLESPAETAVSELLKSGSLGVSNTATSDAPSKGDEHQRRNSKMSPLAGPYLTAEKGLSRGYWAADQDQLKSDEAMEESSHKSERGGDSKDEAKA